MRKLSKEKQELLEQCHNLLTACLDAKKREDEHAVHITKAREHQEKLQASLHASEKLAKEIAQEKDALLKDCSTFFASLEDASKRNQQLQTERDELHKRMDNLQRDKDAMLQDLEIACAAYQESVTAHKNVLDNAIKTNEIANNIQAKVRVQALIANAELTIILRETLS